jgi:head-tail adaptor
LADAGRFAELDGPVSVPARRQLLELLGPWGIHLACGALREGLAEEETREHLFEESGIPQVSKLIVDHFGNRATLIKLGQAVRSARLLLARYSERRSQVTEQIGNRIEMLERSEQGFAEIAALSIYYRNELADFEQSEIDDLLRVTGERGMNCAVRLNVSPDASLSALAEKAVERVRYWATRANDPLLGRGGRQVARTMLRSYEGIAYRIHLAMQFLEMVD